MNFFFSNIVVDYFIRGGPIMWPILFCLVAALVVVAERALWWWSLQRRVNDATLNETFESIAQGRFEHAVKLTRQGNQRPEGDQSAMPVK